MDLHQLFLNNSAGLYDNHLNDGSWQHATIYNLDSASTFWNAASIISLPKQHATTAPGALLYLLQAEAKALTIWHNCWGNAVPATNDFVTTIMAQKRFTNTTGRATSTEIFWKEFKDCMAGLTSGDGFQLTINGIATPYKELLQQDDLVQVICFDESWQEQNYFVETTHSWLLYHWSTAA